MQLTKQRSFNSVSGYNYAATTKRVGVVKNWVKNLKNVNILKWTSTTFTSPFLIQSPQKFSLKGIIQGLSKRGQHSLVKRYIQMYSMCNKIVREEGFFWV